MVNKTISEKSISIKPFLKWAGGKRKLLTKLMEYAPENYLTYHEPFVGGGALLLALHPKSAVINDINTQLITVYRVIRDNVEALINELRKHKNNKEYFYQIRNLDRRENFNALSDTLKAARIIYLNKTCYNGLFRVNKKGFFNVPFGRYKNPDIVNEENLRAVSDYLRENHIELLNIDFQEALKKAKKGDFVYLDPPYHPINETSNFTNYTDDGFGKKEQIKLKQTCDELNERGCFFLLSNSYTPFIREIYKDYEKYTITVQMPRSINCKASSRGKINELLIKNYE